MKRLAALFIILILVAGCPQEEERFEYSIDSLSIEGREHIFSENYKIFVKLSENSFSSENTLILYQGSTKIAEYPLSEEIPEGKQLIFGWTTIQLGEHELKAVLHGMNDTEVSDAKALTVSVMPLGFYEFESDALHHPVETGVWCAQQFTLENSVQVSEIQLHLRSLVPTPKNTLVSLELWESSGSMPGEGEEGTVKTLSISSTNVQPQPGWHSFVLDDEVPAGTYWILLKRDSSVGNIAWTYANGDTANGAYCKDLTVSEEWFPIEGSFAFKVQ